MLEESYATHIRAVAVNFCSAFGGLA